MESQYTPEAAVRAGRELHASDCRRLTEEIEQLKAEVERWRAVVPKMAQLLRDYLESCAFLHQAEGEIGYGPCSCETCAGAREILREIEGG